MPGAEAPAGTLPAFAVDKMLGRLARWLRILGHDVAYGPHLSGRTLVDRARRERRLLLTRDTRLLRDPDLPPHIFVASDHFREQLRQVADAVPLGGAFLHRCLDCNRVLEPVTREAVAAHVPPYVLANFPVGNGGTTVANQGQYTAFNATGLDYGIAFGQVSISANSTFK